MKGKEENGFYREESCYKGDPDFGVADNNASVSVNKIFFRTAMTKDS
jgi:uncharacterized protein (DUF2237 family)